MPRPESGRNLLPSTNGERLRQYGRAGPLKQDKPFGLVVETEPFDSVATIRTESVVDRRIIKLEPASMQRLSTGGTRRAADVSDGHLGIGMLSLILSALGYRGSAIRSLFQRAPLPMPGRRHVSQPAVGAYALSSSRKALRTVLSESG